MEKRNEKKGGMVEEKVYYRFVGEHSQRQTHPGEFRVVMTLNYVGRWEGKGEGGPRIAAKRSKIQKRGRGNQNVWIIQRKVSGEGLPNLWTREFRVESEVCQLSRNT